MLDDVSIENSQAIFLRHIFRLHSFPSIKKAKNPLAIQSSHFGCALMLFHCNIIRAQTQNEMQ